MQSILYYKLHKIAKKGGARVKKLIKKDGDKYE